MYDSYSENDIERINSLLYQIHKIHSDYRPDIFKQNEKKYSNDEILKIIKDKKKPIYVYTDDEDTVLGYAFCIIKNHVNNQSLTNRKEMYIDDLCVDSAFRRKGIGKALYNYVLKQAKEMKCYHVTLNVWCFNKEAIEFYRGVGLKPLKIFMEQIIE